MKRRHNRRGKQSRIPPFPRLLDLERQAPWFQDQVRLAEEVLAEVILDEVILEEKKP